MPRNTDPEDTDSESSDPAIAIAAEAIKRSAAKAASPSPSKHPRDTAEIDPSSSRHKKPRSANSSPSRATPPPRATPSPPRKPPAKPTSTLLRGCFGSTSAPPLPSPPPPPSPPANKKRASPAGKSPRRAAAAATGEGAESGVKEGSRSKGEERTDRTPERAGEAQKVVSLSVTTQRANTTTPAAPAGDNIVIISKNVQNPPAATDVAGAAKSQSKDLVKPSASSACPPATPCTCARATGSRSEKSKLEAEMQRAGGASNGEGGSSPIRGLRQPRCVPAIDVGTEGLRRNILGAMDWQEETDGGRPSRYVTGANLNNEELRQKILDAILDRDRPFARAPDAYDACPPPTREEVDRSLDDVGGRRNRMLGSRMDSYRWRYKNPNFRSERGRHSQRRVGLEDPDFKPRPGDVIIRQRKRMGLRMIDFYFYDDLNDLEDGDKILRAKFQYNPQTDTMELSSKLYMCATAGSLVSWIFLDATEQWLRYFTTRQARAATDNTTVRPYKHFVPPGYGRD